MEREAKIAYLTRRAIELRKTLLIMIHEAGSGHLGGGVLGGAHYCASKAGVLRVSKSLARKLVLDGITVNCVCPGAAATEIRAGISDELEQKIADGVPLKRVAVTL